MQLGKIIEVFPNGIKQLAFVTKILEDNWIEYTMAGSLERRVDRWWNVRLAVG